MLTRLGIVLVASCIASAATDAQTPLTVVQVASGLDQPTLLKAPPGDHHRLFVVELPGRIRIIEDGTLLPTPFLDLTGTVRTGSGQGLHGLAFHPDYAANGWFYVSYTRLSDAAAMVERYTVSSDPNLALPGSGVTILGPVAQPGTLHNGGQIHFGADGMLYIGMGDGGIPTCAPQNGNSLLGKILRVAPDGTIPASNPFVGNPDVRDEIWCLGLRNPWGFSFDRTTGDLYIGDVGDASREEINFQSGSSAGGENYGWERMEGTMCNAGATCPGVIPPCGDPSFVAPIHEYPHLAGPCGAGGGAGAVTGGRVYRGCAIPDLVGTYFFGDYCTGQASSFRYDGASVQELTDRTAELSPPGRPLVFMVAIGEDADGELYLIEFVGFIWKIVPNVAPPATNLGFGLAGTNGEPTLDVCGLFGPGQSATLRLRDALPSSAAAWMLNSTANPVPILGGTLVPNIVGLASLPVPIDAKGEFLLPLVGGITATTLTMQFLVLDGGAPRGVAFSNGLEVTWP